MRELQPCGTRAAYKRHLYHGERCEICRLAENERSRVKGKTPNGTCSRCGRPVVRSRSSNPEIVCHPCRRAAKEAGPCARPGCTGGPVLAPRRFCSLRCAHMARRFTLAGDRRPRAPKASELGVYGREHRQIRDVYVAALRDGDPCSICGGPMNANEPWLLHLHHDPATGEYAGLAHAGCNCAEGAARGNAGRPDDRPPFPGTWLAARRAERRRVSPVRPIRPPRLCACGEPLGSRSGNRNWRCAACQREIDWQARALRDAGLRWVDVAEIIGYSTPAGAYLAASRA